VIYFKISNISSRNNIELNTSWRSGKTFLYFTQISQLGMTEGESEGEKMGRMFLGVI
jgi:hypothetical protein